MLLPLTKGQFAIVDPDVFEWASAHKWYALRSNAGFYAARNYVDPEKGNRHIFLHRLVANAKHGEQVDHINRNTLDCRSDNLRIATDQQNRWNKNKFVMKAGRATPFIGVFHGGNGRWRAAISHDGKRIYLGYFDTQEDAARAYDKKCKELRGAFAALNFPIYGTASGTETIEFYTKTT